MENMENSFFKDRLHTLELIDTFEGINAELDSVRTRHILLFFRAKGKLRDKDHFNELLKSCDELDEGMGASQHFTNMLKKKIDKTRPSPWTNALVAISLCVVVLFVAVATLAYRGYSSFDARMSDIDKAVAEGEYEGAWASYDSAFSDFSPSILRFTVEDRYAKALSSLKERVEDRVRTGITQIQIILDANDGKFDSYTKDYLLSLLAISPKDERLLDLQRRCTE